MPSRMQYNHSQIIGLTLIAATVAGCSTVSLSPAPTAEPALPGQAERPKTAAKNLPALPPAGSGRGGYYMDDGPGDDIPDGLHDLPDAEPKVESYARSGNRPYKVFGKQYFPFTDDRPFKQRGMGSWYGKKFHGQKTSSGEPYDMYKMTAAHPTMPLPSYARVKNLANGRQVIVRVNDRGPFHSGRIIDLSYAAALKLDYLSKGSAMLEVERLLPQEIERIASGKREQTAAARAEAQSAAEAPVALAPAAANPQAEAAPVKPVAYAQPMQAAADASASAATPAPGFYIQLGAYSQAGNAEAARNRLMQNWATTLPPLTVVQSGSMYRVHSGPYASRAEAASIALQLRNAGAGNTTIVQH